MVLGVGLTIHVTEARLLELRGLPGNIQNELDSQFASTMRGRDRANLALPASITILDRRQELLLLCH